MPDLAKIECDGVTVAIRRAMTIRQVAGAADQKGAQLRASGG
jgi:hypothetical protein